MNLDILIIQLDQAMLEMSVAADHLIRSTDMQGTGRNYLHDYVREQRFVLNKMHEILKELT